MNILKRLSSEIYIVALCFIVFFVLRSFPFRFSAIPLGYDAGLYKSMFLSYSYLGATRDFTLLPQWIQTMYEPGLGMIGSLRLLITGGWTDNVLTWGIVVISFLPVLGIWVLARRRGTVSGYFALFFALFSFTQYEVFWRHYRKQLIGMFFVAIIIRVMMRQKRYIVIPFLSALLLVNRAGALLIALILAVLLFRALRKKHWSEVYYFILVGVVSGIVVFPVLYPLWKTLFGSLWGAIIQSIDLPNYNEGFQAGGTFLTTFEYLIVGFLTIAIALGGSRVVYKKSARVPNKYVLHIACILLVVWVVGQGFFFQRMIGYVDMIVLVYGGIWCGWMWGGSRTKKMFVVLCLITQIVIWSYRTYRTYRPLIEKEEFAFLTQIATTIPKDGVVIVPGIDYSPRVQGRTQREVLAPGLYDINQRGNLDQERTSKRLQASAQEKCLWVQKDYPQLSSHPVYLRIGSKQPRTDLTNACFELIQQGEFWSRWKVKVNY